MVLLNNVIRVLSEASIKLSKYPKDINDTILISNIENLHNSSFDIKLEEYYIDENKDVYDMGSSSYRVTVEKIK